MDTLFALPDSNPQHPAKYTDVLIVHFARMLQGSKSILDPFAGTGKVFLLNHWLPNADIQGIEIEPEWAEINPRTTLGSALSLPWDDRHFDAICTSPTYGNRMADMLLNSDKCIAAGYTYITYAQKLNRPLHKDNSGSMQWGVKYKDFHAKAWAEAKRVLRVGGVFVLNIKNHIRAGAEQYVTEWHIEELGVQGFALQEHIKIDVPSMRYGQNNEKRIPYESVIKFVKERE